jgi:aspartate racemase
MEPIFSVIDSPEKLTDEVVDHFVRHDEKFFPSLSSRNGIHGYIASIFEMNGRLILCHIDHKLVAVMGFGLDHPEWKTYYQYIAVDKEYQNLGLPKKLTDVGDEISLAHGETRVVARTWSTNLVMIRFFSVQGYVHFKTIYDDRGKGIHTLFFTRLLRQPEFRQPVTRLAIIGGMGTYSTGNFIKTLTGIPRSTRKEQNLLPFILLNEPSIPDRTECILEDRVKDFIYKVNETICQANPADVSHIVFLCFTLHPYIDQLSLNDNIEKISLIHIIAGLMRKTEGKTILIATKGTYFNSPFYDFGFVLPEAADRDAIHKIIMQIKSGADPEYYKEEITAYTVKYDCNRMVLGCTDLHGMFGSSRKYNGIDIIDPLFELVLLIETARAADVRAVVMNKMVSANL